MSLEGPQVRYARGMEDEGATVAHALELARQVELLLEALPAASTSLTASGARAHSTRMARAMAASLVDELEALVRGRPRSDIGSG